MPKLSIPLTSATTLTINWGTALVAAGLLGKAIFDLSTGQYVAAGTDFIGFLGTIGLNPFKPTPSPVPPAK